MTKVLTYYPDVPQRVIEALEQRFYSKVNKHSGTFWEGSECWEWTAFIHPDGYGIFWFDGRMRGAHIYAHTIHTGKIPEGMTVDHKCRNRRCVNPAHLEVVTHTINVLRGDGPTAQNARKTHCKHGHEFTPENTYTSDGKRHCRTCCIARAARQREKARERALVG